MNYFVLFVWINASNYQEAYQDRIIIQPKNFKAGGPQTLPGSVRGSAEPTQSPAIPDGVGLA
jgi:hypothetical protein